MKRIVGMFCTAALLPVFSLLAEDQPNVFWWSYFNDSSNTYHSYHDVNNWTYGTEESHTEVPAAAPGENDWIAYIPHWSGGPYGSGWWRFDLENQDVTVKGFWEGANIWYPYRTLFVKNGTMTFTELFTTRRHTIATVDNGHIVFGPNCKLAIRWGGAENKFETRVAGTTMKFLGEIEVDSAARWKTYANTSMTIDPTKFWFYTGSANPYSSIENNGTMDLPHGLQMESNEKRTKGGDFEFIQTSGTMTIGGALTYTGNLLDNFSFALNGGTLKITNDVSMTFMNTVGMPNANATATLEIADGMTLDWSNATFAEGTTLNVTGEGKLILGASAPTTLNLSGEGGLEFARSITLGTVTGYETTQYSIDPKSRDRIVITTDNEALRTLIANSEPGANRQWTTEGTDLVSEVTDSRIFIRDKSDSTYRSFSDPTYWLEGTRYGSATATDSYPGYNDWIGFVANADSAIYTFNQNQDLDGKHYKIKGISVENVPSSLQGYGYRNRGFSNGTMEFTESYYVHRDYVTVNDDAKLIIAPTCASDVQWGGAENEFKIYGELDWQGTISLCSLRILSYAGSTVNFAPSAIALNNGAAAIYSCFDNSGTMKFPSGLAYTANGKHSYNHPYYFYQRAGVMEVGGGFTRASDVTPAEFTFDLIGGTLNVTGNSVFTLFDSYGMLTSDTTATIEIAAGKVLDWSQATFAAGTTLNVTGAGTIILGANYPATLNLAAGVTLGVQGPNAALQTINGVADANFYIPDAACYADRPVIVASGDAALVAAIGAKLTCENADWSFKVEGSTITLVEPTNRPHQFIWKGGQSVASVLDYRLWSTEWEQEPLPWQDQAWKNPRHYLPGENDYWLYGNGSSYFKFYFDMGGQKFRIGGFFGDGGLGSTYAWYEHYMIVTNGELEIVHNFTNYYILGTVRKDAKFTLAETSCSRLGCSGAKNNWTIEDGGEIDYLGTLILHNTRVWVNAGAKFVLDPVAAAIDNGIHCNGTYADQGFFNSGDMEIPHGFALTSHNKAKQEVAEQAIWTIRSSGNLLLGGDISFTQSAQYDIARLRFEVQGGAINVTNDTAFIGLDSVAFAEANTAITISEGATLDLSPATFGDGVGLTVSGAGALAVSKSMPSSLALGEGTTLKLTEMGISLEAVTGYSNANLVFVGEIFSENTIVTCANGLMAIALAEKLQLPPGYKAVRSGSKLVAAAEVPEAKDVTCFQSEGEKSLADDQGSWNTEGGAVPQGGDVFVSGENTIAVLDADTVAYDSISVMRGATLKVTGAPTSLPAITLYYGSRLLFADGASVALTEAITAHAKATEMPIVEVASNAVVQVADGYAFKNQHLKNYGTIQFAGAGYIGTAEVGETALFQLTAIGGKFDFQVNGKEIRWVAPKAAGGRVQVIGKVLLKDARSYASKYNAFRCSVGRDNPADEVFDFELDNTTLMLESSTSEYMAGGVRFKCYNGGKIEKAPSSNSPGLYAHINFSDAAQAVFEGEASRFLYFYNRYPVSFRCPDDGHEVMTFKDGAYLHMMHFEGVGESVVGFEDGFWDITEKPAYDANYWKKEGRNVEESETQNYLTAPFTGFKAIRVASGKKLGLRSFSLNEGSKQERAWNRQVKLANVPVTGENGSMYVVNAAAGQSLQVTLTCGSNTATGELWAEPSADGCELLLADGANWAGTLVANECISFTNLTTAASPATVTVGNVRMNGRFPIRVWKGATENAADQLTITGTLAKTCGGFAPIEMNGAAFAVGDTFTIGTIAAAQLPSNYERHFTSSKWKLVAEGDGETKTLKLVYDPLGAAYLLK